MKKVLGILTIVMLCSAAGYAGQKIIRATELSPSFLSELSSRTTAVVIEFKRGDQLPFSFAAKGELLETTQAAPSIILVKRDFWLKVNGNAFEVSLDGQVYKPLAEALSGSVSAGAGTSGQSGTARAIELVLEANVK